MTRNTDHLLHPHPAAEQLRAIFEGKDTADGARIATLAEQVLTEHGEARDLSRALWSALKTLATDDQITRHDSRLDDELLPRWLTFQRDAPETWQSATRDRT